MSDIYGAGTSGRLRRPTLANFMEAPDDCQIVLRNNATGLKFQEPKPDQILSTPPKFQKTKSRHRTGSVIVHGKKGRTALYDPTGDHYDAKMAFFRALNKAYGIRKIEYYFILSFDLNTPLYGRDVRRIRALAEQCGAANTQANIEALRTPYYGTKPPILGETYKNLSENPALCLHKEDSDHPDLISQLTVVLDEDPAFHDFPLSLEEIQTVADRAILQFAEQGIKEKSLKFGLLSRELIRWPRELLHIIGSFLIKTSRPRSQISIESETL